MTIYYKLVDRVPVECDMLEWAAFFETADRRVAQDTLANGITVSTVFLGIDHRILGDGPPLLFETMVWSGGIGSPAWVSLDMRRCSTWDEAVAQHAEELDAVSGNAS
ncbi:hypothetical protein [Sphingobium sp. DC-2]|uniref:hypothetical protein n=1 Tax=Sphingobium sp. DC-2 TaxID=1303256 RepID=UPI000691088C|nr:hypothetical protein [Sphingobium sp. DC-2]